MSFLSSLVRTTRTWRPITSNRFASTLANRTTRKYHRSLAWGAAFSAAACLTLSCNAIYLDSPTDKLPVMQKTEEDETIVDPSTSIAFPKTMRIPSNVKLPHLSLIGVGVRTVSFLGVKVYSIGFYADLSNPNLAISAGMSPEDKIEHIVRNTACVIRIVPTRNTSFTHLRDAFMRAMNARLSEGLKNGTITQEMAAEVASPLRILKSIFPNSPLSKHTPLDIFLAAPSTDRQRPLVFRDLGSIESNWVATEFVLNYFDVHAPSPALKAAVTENLKTFTK